MRVLQYTFWTFDPRDRNRYSYLGIPDTRPHRALAALFRAARSTAIVPVRNDALLSPRDLVHSAFVAVHKQEDALGEKSLVIIREAGGRESESENRSRGVRGTF